MYNKDLFFLIFNLNGLSPILDKLMFFGAEYLIYLTIMLMFFLIFKGGKKEKKAALFAIVTIPIAIILIKITHIFFYEPRPFVTFHFSPILDKTADASFPSRHATIMAVIAFAYAYLRSKWTLLFLLFMVVVGISRIFVGVHYPLDILGGFIFGIISLAITLQIKKLLKINLA